MNNTFYYNLPQRMAGDALRKAESELYDKHLRGDFDEGDPNHPMYNNGCNYATDQYVSLFGYKQKEFMLKQYKTKRIYAKAIQN